MTRGASSPCTRPSAPSTDAEDPCGLCQREAHRAWLRVSVGAGSRGHGWLPCLPVAARPQTRGTADAGGPKPTPLHPTYHTIRTNCPARTGRRESSTRSGRSRASPTAGAYGQLLMGGQAVCAGGAELNPIFVKYTLCRRASLCLLNGPWRVAVAAGKRPGGCGEGRPWSLRGAAAVGPLLSAAGVLFHVASARGIQVGRGGQQGSGKQVHTQGPWLSHLDSQASLTGGRIL